MSVHFFIPFGKLDRFFFWDRVASKGWEATVWWSANWSVWCFFCFVRLGLVGFRSVCCLCSTCLFIALFVEALVIY